MAAHVAAGIASAALAIGLGLGASIASRSDASETGSTPSIAGFVAPTPLPQEEGDPDGVKTEKTVLQMMQENP
ncbi:MAG: hypothetical protein AAF726_23490 [Planctomycetota bacterium]